MVGLRNGFIGVVGSSEWDRWGVVGLRNGFSEISRMGLVGCLNRVEFEQWVWWDAKTGLGIARQRWMGLLTRMGLNKMGLSKKRKEGRGTEHSLSRGRDEDGDLIGEDLLGNHFKWSVLELSLTLSLRVCSMEIC